MFKLQRAYCGAGGCPKAPGTGAARPRSAAAARQQQQRAPRRLASRRPTAAAAAPRATCRRRSPPSTPSCWASSCLWSWALVRGLPRTTWADRREGPRPTARSGCRARAVTWPPSTPVATRPPCHTPCALRSAAADHPHRHHRRDGIKRHAQAHGRAQSSPERGPAQQQAGLNVAVAATRSAARIGSLRRPPAPGPGPPA